MMVEIIIEGQHQRTKTLNKIDERTECGTIKYLE